MNRKRLALLALVCSIAHAGALSGSYTVKNPTPDSGPQYTFPESSYHVFVIHHVGAEVC